MLHNLTRFIFRWIFLVALLLAFASCYEDAIPEKLLIEFTNEGNVRLESVVEFIDAPDSDNAPLKQRLATVRAEYEREQDPWTRRFSGLYSLKDRYVRERQEEDLLRVERLSETTPSNLPRFFDDTNITVSIIEGRGWREVAFYPATSTRASQQQRTQLLQSLEQWSRALATYLRAEEQLFQYVATHPDRARHVLGTVLQDVLSEQQTSELELQGDAESALIDELFERMTPLLESMRAAENQPYSLDELSSLVFDPFPAEVTVRVPGPILEVEGFEVDGQSLRVPKLRLWGALESLQETWISPDLLVAYVETARAGEQRLDLESFLAKERRVVMVPSETAVRLAIEQRLARKPVYRVRWVV